MRFYLPRYQDVEEHRFKVEVVTPLFMGGADPASPELRVPPIKGLLRFWWRALYGSEDIQTMKQNESEIFGSTDHRSSFDLMIENQSITKCKDNLPRGREVPVPGKSFAASVIHYLAYGIQDFKQGCLREYIKPGSSFEVVFRTKSKSPEILRAWYALTNYGGLGAKSRNGFGSLHVSPAKDITGEIKAASIKKFTTFSDKAIVFPLHKRRSWQEALSDAGFAYREARISLDRRHDHTNRRLIATPIFVNADRINISERQTKPYFLHIAKEGTMYRPRILFLPYAHQAGQRYLDACAKMNEKIRETIKTLPKEA